MISLGMISKTEQNVPLFGADADVSPAVARRLESSFAPFFAEHILPVLLRLEGEFEVVYPAETGRPAWSPARKVGLLILKEVFRYTDEELISALCFDLRFQVALGFAKGDDPHISRRSLIEFRTRLVDEDPEMTLLRRVFDEIADEAIEKLGLDISEQRIDSTLVRSNIRDLARVELLKTTLIVFLRELYRHDADRLGVLPDELQDWYCADEPSWFGKESDNLTLEQLGDWLFATIDRFESDEAVSSWESFEHVRQVFGEHFTLDPDTPPEGPDSGEPSAAEPSPASGETIKTRKPSQAMDADHTLQSPFDPDAAYGHKGTGYSLHLSETCRNDGPEIITDFHLVSANQNDFDKAKVLLGNLDHTDRLPTTAYVDAGYITASSLEDAENRGVELYGPAKTHISPDAIGRESFEFDGSGRVIRCPNDQEPIDHRVLKYDNRRLLHAVFERPRCTECPLFEQCMSRKHTSRLQVLPLEHKLTLRDRRLAAQRDDSWWEDYSTRSAIEATNSELKRRYGLRKLRVRRRPSVLLATIMKVIACNARRWHRGTAAPSATVTKDAA